MYYVLWFTLIQNDKNKSTKEITSSAHIKVLFYFYILEDSEKFSPSVHSVLVDVILAFISQICDLPGYNPAVLLWSKSLDGSAFSL